MAMKLKEFRFNRFDPYLLVFLVPLIINPWGYNFYELPKSVYLRVFIGLFLLAACVYFFIKKKIHFAYSRPAFILILLWLFSLLLSTLFSVAPNLSLWGSYSRMQGLVQQVFYVLHFVIFYQYIQLKGSSEKFFNWVFYLGLAVGIYAILQKFGIYIFSLESNDTFVGRVFSTLGQPNLLGQFLIVPIWFALGFLERGKNFWKKFFYAGALTVLVAAFILTENRSSFFGMAFAIGLYFAFFSSLFRRIKWVLLALLMLISVVFVVLVIPNTRSLSSRVLIWSALPDLVMDHAILGNGPETLSVVFPKVYPPGLVEYEAVGDIPDRAHNEIFDVLISQGFLGLAVYMAAVLGIIFAAIKKKELFTDSFFRISFFAFIALLISDLFNFQLTSNWLLWFSLAAVIVSYLSRGRQVAVNSKVMVIAVTVLVFFVSALNVVNAGKMLAADMVFGQAIDQLDRDDLSASVKNMGLANVLNPDQGDLAYVTSLLMGNAAIGLNNTDLLNVADSYLEISRRFYGDTYSYYLKKAEFSGFLGKQSEAAGYFGKALGMAPNLATIYQGWGMELYKEKRYAEAVDKLGGYFSLLPQIWKKGGNLPLNSDDKSNNEYRIFVKTTPGFLESLQAMIESCRMANRQDLLDQFDGYLPKKPR